MNCELTIKTGNQERKAFLQEGFYTELNHSVHIHKHNYTEVHLLSGGTFVFDVEGKRYVTEGDTLIVIPAEKFHSYSNPENGSLHTAFQIDFPAKEIVLIKTEKGIISSFFKEARRVLESGDYSTICAYISMFCSYFCKDEKITGRQISDYGFLICEFFSNRYSSNVSLEDLSKTLCLSPRQTERCVKRYTGMTFNEKLTSTRLTMARQLIQTSDMTFKEIADYVGYRSYSGFWKALKREKRGKNN